MAAIGLRKGTLMDKDKAAPAGQDPGNSSSPDSGTTIPKSSNGVGATSTPGKSTFEPEEDPPAGDSDDAGTGGAPADKA